MMCTYICTQVPGQDEIEESASRADTFHSFQKWSQVKLNARKNISRWFDWFGPTQAEIDIGNAPYDIII
jgi:hypothetical protein